MKNFLDFLKLPPTILAALAMVSGAVLFLPELLLYKLGLSNLPDFWKIIIGLVFLITSALLFIYLVIYMCKKVGVLYSKVAFNRNFSLDMRRLSPQEKAILMNLYKEPNLTAFLSSVDGIVARLASKTMIQVTAKRVPVVGRDLKMPYTITPGAVKYIKSHLTSFES